MIASSAQQTADFAAQYAKTLRPGDVVLLRGEMGAGKTVFVQGAAVFVFSGNKERRIKMPAIRSKALHWIRKHGIIIPPLIVNKVASALRPIA